jgi:putative endopeptidase
MMRSLSTGLVPTILVAAAVVVGGSCSRTRSITDRRTTHGVDIAGMDRSVAPGSDFFKYANGTWDRNTPIPPDQAAWGIGGEVDEEATKRTRVMLEAAAAGHAELTSDEGRVGAYYTAYMDEASIEARGVAALTPALDRIASISDRSALARELGAMLRADVDPLNATNFHTDRMFGLWVAQDLNWPTRNTPYLLQGGLAMPDREYYLADNPRMADIRAKYRSHVATVLSNGGVGDAQKSAGQVVALETKIARAHWSLEDSEDVHKANNRWTREEFPAKAPGLDWTAFFKGARLEAQPTFIVWQPSAIAGESALVASESIEVWKVYLRYSVLDHWSSLLPKAFADEQFEFYGKTLSGTPQMPERWKRAVSSANNALGDAIGQLYVKRYFPPESKARAEAMVADIKSAFAARIDRLDWMSSATKAKAKEKLQTLIVGIGYPDKWRDYSGLQIARNDALGNAMRAEEYEYNRRVAELLQPIDRTEWWMTPQTVNAVNLPIQNALNFPAAILQPPYFDPKAEAANNYGAIGAVIGHEISHSFDNLGSQFDGSGKLANWWLPADFDHFKAAAARLVAQYNAYRPFPDASVNGQQTLAENIADVAGLAASYDAYHLSLGGRPAPVQEGFDGDQQFFISFAQSWRTKFREPLLRQLLVTDGHSPAPYRVTTVRNLDAWYAAFAVKSGDPLYLAPADRVRVW